MAYWKRLDMASKTGHPPADMLVALYLDPTNGRSTCYRRVEYDIGCFKSDSRDNSRKLWWHGKGCVQDPSRMKKHYDIYSGVQSMNLTGSLCSGIISTVQAPYKPRLLLLTYYWNPIIGTRPA